MNYFPNIEKLNAIIKVLLNDNSNTKSKLEYLIHDYLIEDYKVFDKSVDYWITTNMITTTLLSKIDTMNPDLQDDEPFRKVCE